MKKPLDRVSEAYFDQMGEEFGEQVRKRVHWVCEKAIGDSVLDVGCSQGITSILLGREGKQVLGIDLLEESITYAKEALQKESNVTQKYVDFQVANFNELDFQDQKFDVIILGEVLEHLTHPKKFIAKSKQILNKDGRLIITLPFGINNYFDHKKTYYVTDLIDLIDDELTIVEFELIGKWFGAVIQFKTEQSVQPYVNYQLMKETEENFHRVEQQYIDRINKINEENKRLKYKFNQLTQEKQNLNQINLQYDSILSILNKINERQIQLDQTIASDEKVLEGIQSTINNIGIEKKEEMEKEKSYLKDEISKLKQELTRINTELQNGQMNDILDMLKMLETNQKSSEHTLLSEEQELEDIKVTLGVIGNTVRKISVEQSNKYQEEIAKLKEELTNSNKNLQRAYESELQLKESLDSMQKKYNKITQSKLGRMTLFYWKARRKLFKK